MGPNSNYPMVTRSGGTNPFLVEALGTGNAVLAHANPFNRWVAGPEARYFMNET